MSTPLVDMSDYEQLGCQHDMFIAQAKKTPHRVAVVGCDGRKTTYEELDTMTDLLANKLRRLGLRKHEPVGILMEHSLEFTVSYISILKAGGAFVPINVSWPVPLVDLVLKDACPEVICTKEAFVAKVKSSDIPVILLDGDWLQTLKEEQNGIPLNPPIKTSLDDIAYIVYTSGTTGIPKGVQCRHRGDVFAFTWRHRAYPYLEDDREACNIFFIDEMSRPLTNGCPMYIIPDNVIYDPPKLADFIEKNTITRMVLTPSLMEALLEYNGINLQTALKSMRQVMYSGEITMTAVRDKVASLLPWIRQVNVYGISECHDIAVADLSNLPSDYERRQVCPVGKLLPGVHAVVMDHDLNVKSVGEPGEIYIGGPFLAIGYLNRPELNKLRFIARPGHVSPSVGERLFRTGDWGYLHSDGSLEICGRCDTVVKIRGYTIELEAVRSNILDLPGVLSTSVQVYGSGVKDKTMVAFIVPHQDISLTNREIRLQLKKTLPFYMIPSTFIILEKIPVVQSSGKLDTKALSDLYTKLKEQAGTLEVTKVFEGREEAVSPTEMKIANIWSGLLNLFVLDTEESFFDVGGHSLLAASLASKLNEEFGVNLSTSEMFKHPTISAQALLVTSSNNMESSKELDLRKELTKLQVDFGRVDSDIRAFWQAVNLNPGRFGRANVLLTGATGYLGCFLLEELLQRTQTTVYCLVRASPGQTPLDRLAQARLKNGLREYIPTNRAIPIKGDVSLANMGLNKDVYNALCLEIDVVIHAAAQVNLILPFSALYSSNVLGTYNVLLFSLDGQIKPVHYISTIDVFPNGVQEIGENADMLAFADQLKSGYGQTKWLSEQLIQKAANKGFPTATYRCGNVGGSRLVAGWNSADFNLHMLKGVLKTGYAPDIEWKIELTPVDFVSQVIISLMCDIHDNVGKTFHITNNSMFNSKNLWKLLRHIGYKINTTSFLEWKNIILKESKKDIQLFQLGHLLTHYAKDEAFLSSPSTFKQENLALALKKMSLTYPQLTTHLFECYLQNLAGIVIVAKPEHESESE